MLVSAMNYLIRIWLIKKKYTFLSLKIFKKNIFYNYEKNVSPMLTMIGYCRQDNIIYKCTKLHDHSSNRT